MKYVRAGDVFEAVDSISTGAVPVAGGTDLVPRIALGEGQTAILIDVGHILDLRGIVVDATDIRIGATTALCKIIDHSDVQQRCRALYQAVTDVGNPQVRRQATIGGNVALGVPLQPSTSPWPKMDVRTDLPAALLVLDATIGWRRGTAEHSTPLNEMISNGRDREQLITSVQIPTSPIIHSGYRKFARRKASGVAITTIAAALRLEGGIIQHARIAIGGVTEFACRIEAAEAVLVGQVWSASLVRAAARTAADDNSITAVASSHLRELICWSMEQLLEEIVTA
jgi:aerobic carbon-monoxide dehydrogenase medium subunit